MARFSLGPPSRDKFAQLVMDELRRSGWRHAMKYDAEQFVIERGSDGFINLANLYHEYCQALPTSAAKVLDRFIRGCLGTTRLRAAGGFRRRPSGFAAGRAVAVLSRIGCPAVAGSRRRRAGRAAAVDRRSSGAVARL